MNSQKQNNKSAIIADGQLHRNFILLHLNIVLKYDKIYID